MRSAIKQKWLVMNTETQYATPGCDCELCTVIAGESGFGAGPRPVALTARDVKNQLVIDGAIDAAFAALIECREPDAWRVALIELAHAAVDATVAAELALGVDATVAGSMRECLRALLSGGEGMTNSE